VAALVGMAAEPSISWKARKAFIQRGLAPLLGLAAGRWDGSSNALMESAMRLVFVSATVTHAAAHLNIMDPTKSPSPLSPEKMERPIRSHG
jgi:hypothetical protein